MPGISSISSAHPIADNPLLKAVSVVPVVGAIVHSLAVATLGTVYRGSDEAKIARDYCVVAVLRDALSVAAAVSLAVLGILNPVGAAIAGAIFLGLVGYNIYKIAQLS